MAITKDTRGTHKPATSISWNEAARFINWLNTYTGGRAAYKFLTSGVNDDIALWDATSDPLDYDSTNPYRSKRAKYVLPTYNEWYKAAYYNPNDSTYGDFPNGSNLAPTPITSGVVANTAVYGQSLEQGPADVNRSGGLSAYGVMGLGGNAYEWEESSFFIAANSSSSLRGFRGGNWVSPISDFLRSSDRGNLIPSTEAGGIGFRVAMDTPSGGEVPEPSTMAIFGLGALGMAYRARRKAKA